jgi:uncharacterized protein YgiM (DUF1202 family)
MVVVLVAAQTAPTPSPTPPSDRSVVVGQDVYVRGGPGRQYLPVGKLVLGEVVRPVSRNLEGSWVLIIYHDGYGWVRRDLAAWVEDIEMLPIIDETNLTPSPVTPGSLTQDETVILLPTETPTGNWVQVNDAPSGYVRAGPGRTYLRLGQLTTGDMVEPVGRNADTTWILIRFQGGFGWIARNLVRWVDDLESLPVLSPDNLTPSPTFTPTDTPTSTPTSTNTPTFTLTPTVTPSPTASYTPTITPSYTPTSTYTPTNTATFTPLPTNTRTPTTTHTPTYTVAPSVTPTDAPTQTPSATETPVVLAALATNTALPTAMYSATQTSEPSLTPTNTVIPTSTPLPASPTSPLPTATDTAVPTAAASATEIPLAEPIATFNQGVNVRLGPGTQFDPPIGAFAAGQTTQIIAQNPAGDWYKVRYFDIEGWVVAAFVTVTGDTSTLPVDPGPLIPTRFSPTTTPTAIPPTSTPTETAVVLAPTVNATAVPLTSEVSAEAGGIPLEAVVGGIIVLLLLGYIGLYLRGTSAAERYANGFVVDRCPACDRGTLTVETRVDRVLGIPRPRRTVRCSDCRSVLREVGNHRWRYAVDPMENPALYKHYNGHEIDDATLVQIAQQPTAPVHVPPHAHTPLKPPSFVDEDPDNPVG